MMNEKKDVLKTIINVIFIVSVVASVVCFFVMLFEEIPYADAQDDIFGSHGHGFFGVIIYGPILIFEYVIYRLIRLFVFSEKILSENVKLAKHIFLCGSWSLCFSMGVICNAIESAYGFQQAPYLRGYIYFELAWGIIIVFVPAYILGFILSKLIKLLPIKEESMFDGKSNK